MSEKTQQNEHRPPPPPPRQPPRGVGEQDAAATPPRNVFVAWLVVLGMIAVMLFMLNSGNLQRNVQEIDQSEFYASLSNRTIKTCEIIRESTSGIAHVSGVRRKDGKDVKYRVDVYYGETFNQRLVEGGPKVTYPSTFWTQVLLEALPIVLFIGLLYFIFMRTARSAGMGAMNFGKSRAKMLSQDKQKVTFVNVAGIKEAKEEVEEIIAFLKAPQKFQKLGGRIPKGVLLLGPPGTGKTLLAKAIAGEAGVPFFSISGSDFIEMFVGVGASRVRDMFEQGKKHAPCIIFIDEIDAVGRSRFTGIGGGHDEREQTLNALLVEMDGFETSDGVIIIAATNRPDVLDPALLRPGRFDRTIVIDLPTLDGREEILRLHAKKLTLGPNADLRRIARGTPGFSGADLANLLNEAALLAARQDKAAVEMNDLEEARDKVLWGRERRSRAMDDKERRITAWHESGHALVQVLLENTEPVHKVTIIPRGMALGATMSLPEKDILNKTRSQLRDELAVLMGGRIAEKIHTGDISTGARMDIRMASRIARHMVCEYGMSDDLGAQAFGENQELMFLGREVSRTQNYSEETARRIDADVTSLLHEAFARAEKLIEEHRRQLEQVVERLLDVETMDGRDVEDLVKHGRILTEDERKAQEKTEDGERKKEDGKPQTEDGQTVGPSDGKTVLPP
ncbi:MAG: ATP-dependent zinc metalloprotease FtsH [Magnetococcus sp. WYHC-3]